MAIGHSQSQLLGPDIINIHINIQLLRGISKEILTILLLYPHILLLGVKLSGRLLNTYFSI